jgi:hypothetical protein
MIEHVVEVDPPARGRTSRRGDAIQVLLSPAERAELDRLAAAWGVRPAIAAQTLLLRSLLREARST